jgi:HAT1-interacting factor 1
MLVFEAMVAGLKGLMGCAGVAKAGDEEGIGSFAAGVSGNLKIDAARGFTFDCALLMISFFHKVICSVLLMLCQRHTRGFNSLGWETRRFALRSGVECFPFNIPAKPSLRAISTLSQTRHHAIFSLTVRSFYKPTNLRFFQGFPTPTLENPFSCPKPPSSILYTMANSNEQSVEFATLDESSSATEVFNSVKVSLADLCAKGTAQFAHKNYEEAADLFARASELQAELNGDMSPDNAEILFLYGRSLFKVGQSNSDVLGGKASGEEKKKSGAAKPKKVEETESEKITEVGVGIIAGQNGGPKSEDVDSKKPLFQFTGDENFEDSDDDDDVEEAEGGEEEEEDDLAAAFEVLDLARVLFTKRIESPEESEGKGKETGDTPMTRHLKERIADTHDLLAEISLENERFPAAVSDSRSSLIYKQQLYPEESEIIAEAHFKLSLALEFASTTNEKKEGDEEANSAEDEVATGHALREEAVKELQAAINSTNLKLQAKEVELATSHSPDDNEITRAQIADVREIITDMENRVCPQILKLIYANFIA